MLLIIGLILLGGGIGLLYWINERRFNRRGVGGLQHYSSFRRALATSSLEKLAKWISWLLIITGLVFSAGHFLNSHTTNTQREKTERAKSHDPK